MNLTSAVAREVNTIGIVMDVLVAESAGAVPREVDATRSRNCVNGSRPAELRRSRTAHGEESLSEDRTDAASSLLRLCGRHERLEKRPSAARAAARIGSTGTCLDDAALRAERRRGEPVCAQRCDVEEWLPAQVQVSQNLADRRPHQEPVPGETGGVKEPADCGGLARS